MPIRTTWLSCWILPDGEVLLRRGRAGRPHARWLLVVKLTGPVAEIGLGLRPDLTGRGLGESFLRACLHFASAALGAQSCTLAVAAFNRRAITVYERAGFQEAGRFEHVTNGGLHTFIRMTKDSITAP